MEDTDYYSWYTDTRTHWDSNSMYHRYSEVFTPDFIVTGDPDSPGIMSIDSWLEKIFDHDPDMNFSDRIINGDKVHVIERTSSVYVYIIVAPSGTSISVFDSSSKEIFKGNVKDTEIFLIKWSLSV